MKIEALLLKWYNNSAKKSILQERAMPIQKSIQ